MAKAVAKREKSARDPVLVDLALQGGGSHGAFTWGVLDRLLEEPWLKVEAISGTSAGRDECGSAGQRLHAGRRGGRAFRARRLLETCRGSGEIQPATALAVRPNDEPLDARHVPRLSRDGPDVARRFALRPQSARAINPISAILAESIDFAHLAEAPIKLFITGDQRAYRPWARLPQPGDHAGRASRVRLPADHVPGDRDRRRALLGRRLRRQPDHHAAGAGERRARHDSGRRSTRANGATRHARRARS